MAIEKKQPFVPDIRFVQGTRFDVTSNHMLLKLAAPSSTQEKSFFRYSYGLMKMNQLLSRPIKQMQ